MIDELHAKGVRVVLWITPMINVDSPDWQEAADAGYFLKASELATDPAVIHWWKGDGSLIDYFNPEAVAWWHGLIQPVLDLGIDGWKCDGADYYAGLAPYSPGAGRNVARLDYSHAYYQDFFDHTREVLGDDRLIMSRPIDAYGLGLSGDLGAFSPKGVMFAGWVGDQDPTFDGMRVALENFWQSAAYGYLAFGSDIGGYREDDSELGRTEEVFLRWAGLGAFSPVMENGGGGAHEPWKFSEQATAAYKGFADLHHALVPYLMATGARAFAEEASMLRFLDDEAHEAGVATYDFRYRIGDDLFVQPVLASGTSVTVTMPDEGRWTWLFGDHATYDAGATVTLDVPLDAYPAFVREGTTLAQSLVTVH
jgi:alpha-glucosidase (family GH31 glycosyl hydrolase)